MKIAQALLYLAGVVLLVAAAVWRPQPSRPGLVPLAGACALLAFSLPVLVAGL
jgi:hypothetical protein